MEGANWRITDEEAGPSSSSGIASTKQQNPPETFHHQHHRKEAAAEEEETEEEEEDDVDHHNNSTFVPGPLLSLKDQIEKDKVFRFSPPHLLFKSWVCSKFDFFFYIYLFLLNGLFVFNPCILLKALTG